MITDTIPETIAARIERAVEEQCQKARQEERQRDEEQAQAQQLNDEAWAAFAANATAQIGPDVAPYLAIAKRNSWPSGSNWKSPRWNWKVMCLPVCTASVPKACIMHIRSATIQNSPTSARVKCCSGIFWNGYTPTGSGRPSTALDL